MVEPQQRSDEARSEGEGYWEEARRRIEAADAVLTKGWVPSPEEKARILRQRAQALAPPPVQATPVGEIVELIVFDMAQGAYGVEASFVREVHPMRELTAVPCTPPFVLGIINLRGQVLSVIDIRQVLGLPEADVSDSSVAIVIGDDKSEFGILADAVLGARPVVAGEIQPSLSTMRGRRAEYTKGLTTDRVVVLDVARMLADERLRVREEVE